MSMTPGNKPYSANECVYSLYRSATNHNNLILTLKFNIIILIFTAHVVKCLFHM